MTTKPLSDGEQRHIDAVTVWLDSMADMAAISTDNLWGESTAATGIPTWVHIATARLDDTLFASATTALDKLELTPYRAGFAIGMLEWGERQMKRKPTPAEKAIARRVKLSTRAKRIISKKLEVFFIKVGFITKRELQRSKYIPNSVSRYVRNLNRGPIFDLSEFHRGKSEGLRGLGAGTPRDRSDLSTEILFILVIFWRAVVRFKSVTELHGWLTRIMGAEKIGEKKRVEKICERIGLTLRERGRPKENPTPALPA